MLIKTRPASARVFLSLEARAATKDSPSQMLESVSFDLIPTQQRDHLDLDTGEVFQDYSYAKGHGNDNKLIPASITIQPSGDVPDYQCSIMRYFGEQKGVEEYVASSIYFSVFVEPFMFRELVENARSGLLPDNIMINLKIPIAHLVDKMQPPVMEYGWEADGSGMIWHNEEKANRTILIESVKFYYAVVKHRYDEEQPDRPLPLQSNSSTDKINEQIAVIQTNVAGLLKYTRWTTMGIVVLACMVAILIVRRGASLF